MTDVWINGVAASALEIDRPEKWPGIKTRETVRLGKGWRYLVSAPDDTLRAMLDECDSRGAQRGGEGWDQDASAASGCRKAAEAIRVALRAAGGGE